MRFTTFLVAAFAAIVSAQENPFTLEPSYSAVAGESTEITWNPTTQGPITLTLRSGPSNNLNAGTVIADSIPNSGSFTWNAPSSLTRGNDYAFQISTADNEINYSAQFLIESDNTEESDNEESDDEEEPTSTKAPSTKTSQSSYATKVTSEKTEKSTYATVITSVKTSVYPTTTAKTNNTTTYTKPTSSGMATLTSVYNPPTTTQGGAPLPTGDAPVPTGAAGALQGHAMLALAIAGAVVAL